MTDQASPIDAVALRDFVAELVLAGLRDVVVCPGSRSTPIALAVRSNPGLRVRVLLDERSAGFFALGIARASRRAVAVVVTSGTAAANLLPAVVEASLGRVPLVILTADRPPELRDRGAPQTIDQNRLFGSYAKWFCEMPLLDGTDDTRRHLRSVAGRAVGTALEGPQGPVHVNLPFREPLIPGGSLIPGASLTSGGPVAPIVPASKDGGASDTRAFADLATGPRILARDRLEDLARTLREHARGLIVAGPQDDSELPAALARLAAATGYPILADPLSLARTGSHDRRHVLGRADLILRPGRWRDAHVPEVVVRFGATPTSKPLNTWLAAVDPSPIQFVVDGGGGWREPWLMRSTFVHADATWTADALADASGEARSDGTGAADDPWTAEWLAAERAADDAARAWLHATTAGGETFEAAPFAPLADLLPDGSILWASSSMPVRDMDAWLPATDRAIRPMSNRGANGIDGVVSSALGAAAALSDAGGGRLALVVGDLAFLHDLNALVAAKLHRLSATIVLVNNDGGGIFSFLPQATADAPDAGLPAHFEELFGTPHGVEVGPLVRALGGRHRLVHATDLRDAIGASLVGDGVDVLELRTDRARNVALHRQAADVVRDALMAQVAP